MTCMTMLDRLLDAEPTELVGEGQSEIAAHVRACARCREIGEQLARDTSHLAAVVRSAPACSPEPTRLKQPTRVSRSATWIGLAACLASIVVIRALSGSAKPAPSIVVRPRSVASARTANNSIHETAHVDSTMHIGPPSRARSRPMRLRTLTSMPVRATSIVPVPATPAVAVVPIRLDLGHPAPTLGVDVQADPPAGVRANVMRTSNPTVTVVWLY